MKYLRKLKRPLAMLLAVTMLLTNVQWTALTVEAEGETELTVTWSNTSLCYKGEATQLPTATITGAEIGEAGIEVNTTNETELTGLTDVSVTMSVCDNTGNKIENYDGSVENYTAKLTLSGDGESDFTFADGGDSCSFEITYKSMDDASISGTQNNDAVAGWYAGDVTITPPTDHGITTDSSWNNTLTYDASQGDGVTYYLKDTDGYISEAKTIATFYIDSTDPVIDSAEVSCEGDWTSSKTVTVTVTEDNIQRVYYEVDNQKTTISEEKGVYSFNITDALNATGKAYTIGVIDNAGNTATAKVTVTKIDGTEPRIDAEVSNADAWTSSKTITVTVTEDNVESVKYYVGEDVTGTDITNSLSGGTFSLNVTDEIGETGTDYKFVVTDSIGNSSNATATVKKIDTTAPTITSDNEGDIVYVNDDQTFTVSFEDEENGSGIDGDTLVIYKDSEVIQGLTWSSNTYETSFEFTPESTDISEEVVYKITGKDNAGNEIEKSFTVVYETDKPVISDVKVNGEIGDSVSEWINIADFETGTPTIEFNVEDASDTNASGMETVTLSTKSGGTETLISEFSLDVNGEYSYNIPKEDFEGTYIITAIDKAGNKTEQIINVNVDVTNVLIETLSIKGGANNDKEDLWYNAEDGLYLEAPLYEATSGIEQVFATTTSGISDIPTDVTESDNYIEGVEDGNSSIYKFVISDEDFLSRTYYFYAYDEAGNVVNAGNTLTLKRDSQAPITDDILVSFAVDVNETEDATIDDKITTFVQNIFAKSKITVHLYIRDDIALDGTDEISSGVDTVEIQYNGDTYAGSKLSDDSHAIVEDNGGNEVAYDIFEFVLEGTTDDTLDTIVDEITITKITDVAGNSCGVNDQLSIVSGNLIIIDDVEPELVEVDYASLGDETTVESVTLSDSTYWFYNMNKTLELNIKEVNFFETIANTEDSSVASEPVFEVNNTRNELSWSAGEETTVAGSFPVFKVGETPSETEYEFTLGYVDPSGNEMISNSYVNATTDGTYSSDIIVMDNLAPELVTFDIVGTAGSITETVGTDKTLYAKNVDGNDITLTVGIDDNAAYFNADDVVVTYRIVGTDTWIELDAQADWAVSDRIHTNTYVFDGVENEDITYEFCVYYADRANNSMVDDTDSLDVTGDDNGSFIYNTKVVIDHVSPEVDIEVAYEDEWAISKVVSIEANEANVHSITYNKKNSLDSDIDITASEEFTVSEELDEMGQDYTITITDKSGNSITDEVNVSKIDRSAAITDTILVSYSINEDTTPVDPTTMYEKFIEYVKNIFAKDTVTMNLYVEDTNIGTSTSLGYEQVASGVQSVTILYNKQKYTTELDYSEPRTHIAIDGSGTYDVFTFTLSGVSETEIESSVIITEIIDAVGNKSEINESDSLEILSGNIVYIDDVAPILTEVDYTSMGSDVVDSVTLSDSKTYWFYNASKVLELEIKETNFFKTIDNTPITDVASKTVLEINSTDIALDWSTGSASNLATSATEFTVEQTASEKEYEFTLEYVDPSGNTMVSSVQESYNINEGTYSSDVIVMDNLAPELVTFDIVGTAGSITETVGTDKTLYAKNVDGNDITLTVGIDDNAAYFNADDVVITYRIVGTDTWIELDAQADWAVSDRIHTNTYVFDGVEDDELTYEFCVYYVDRARNNMIDAIDTLDVTGNNKGSFVNNIEVVIDHEVPEMTDISYTEPIAMYDGDVASGENTNIKNAITDNNTRVYYKDDMTVSFTLEDDYLNQEDCLVKLYNSKGILLDDDVAVNINNGTYTFTISALEDDAEYYFTASYTDRAGNKMIYSADISDNASIGEAYATGMSTGTYKSPIIIQKTTDAVLTEFTFTDANDNSLPENDGIYYALNDAEADDIKLTVTIDEHSSYFVENQVLVQYTSDGGKTWTDLQDPTTVDWTHTDDDHTAIYTFDGVVDGELTYEFRISYVDKVLESLVEATTEDVDTSAIIVIDHEVPEMTAISYTEPIAMYDGDASAENNGSEQEAITDKNTRLYYENEVKISFTLEDDYLFTEECNISLYNRESKTNAWEEVTDVTAYQITKASNGVVTIIIPDADGEYYFTASYADRAGNKMVYSSDITGTAMNEIYDGSLTTGTYRTSIFVVDNTKPVIDVTYTAYDDMSNAIEGQIDVSIDELEAYQAGNKVTAKLVITDKNLQLEDTMIALTQKDINGNDIGTTVEKYTMSLDELLEQGLAKVTSYEDGVYTIMIDFTAESIYTIAIDSVDKVGKTASYSTSNIYLDRTTPEIQVVVDEDGFFTSDSDIQYEVVNGGKFSNLINKITFGYFSQEVVKVTITAHDDISGVDTITYTYDSEENESGADSTAVTVVKDVTLDGDKSETTISFTLPLSFKGTIEAYGTDNSGNVADASKGLGVISETEAKDAATAGASITVLTNEAKTENYYNTDVVVQYSVFDTYSGLNRVQYVAGSVDIADVDYAGSDVVINTKEVVQNYTIVASLNNNNNVETGLSFVDNAGYVTTVSDAETPTIHIDTTDPVITVEYNNNDVLNETYYSEPRIATITIKERNFDPNDTEITITGQGAVISGWTNTSGKPGETDDCTWVATVTFAQDEDYTFTCSTVDLAGNKTEYGQTDEFTIDQTLPTIAVSYSNNESANEYYFNASRTATITVDEHNFNAGEVEVTMTATDKGATTSTPSVSGWTSNGDIHTASVTFDYDGEFTLDVAYADLAGNEAVDYAQDSFVVDLILPVIEILDIEDMSANNGVVSPSINITDTNYDVESVVITITGANNGEVEFGNTATTIEYGQNIAYSNIPEVVENDDLYTLKATATDKAGNVFESAVMFSVNRFGSVYILSDDTEQLVEGYYANEEITLKVQEINVDTLVFQEITYTKDSEVVTLESGVDYTVSESGNEASWKSYDYTIDAANFETEGAYVVNISSEDSASNQMNNKMTETDIEFAIDKTAPSTVVTGVEDEVQYNASTRELIVDAKDNMLLSSVYVYINGSETVLEFKDEELTETNGTISVTLEDSINWQTVSVVSFDAAGNKTMTDEITYLITTNVFYQWYRNTVLFYGSILGVVAVLGAGTYFIAGKRRKKEEKK